MANYTQQLIENLKFNLRGTGVHAYHYKNIYTIRIILPEVLPLKVFADDFYSWLESFPAINAEKEMVRFWLCKEGTADYYLKLINPTDEAVLIWGAIGAGAGTWVTTEHFLHCKKTGEKYSEQLPLL